MKKYILLVLIACATVVPLHSMQDTRKQRKLKKRAKETAVKQTTTKLFDARLARHSAAVEQITGSPSVESQAHPPRVATQINYATTSKRKPSQAEIDAANARVAEKVAQHHAGFKSHGHMVYESCPRHHAIPRYTKVATSEAFKQAETEETSTQKASFAKIIHTYSSRGRWQEAWDHELSHSPLSGKKICLCAAAGLVVYVGTTSVVSYLNEKYLITAN